MFKINNKNIKISSLTSFLSVYCYFWIYSTPFIRVSIVDFEQVDVKWMIFRFAYTAQKMKFSLMLISKCEQIHRKLRLCSHLLNQFLKENFIFCVVVAMIYKLEELLCNWTNGW